MDNIDKLKAKVEVLKHDNREIAKGNRISTGVKEFDPKMVESGVIPENIVGRVREGVYPTLTLAKQIADLFSKIDDGESYMSEYDSHISGNRHLAEYERRGIKPVALLKVIPRYRVSSYKYQEKYYKLGLIRTYDNTYILPIFGGEEWDDGKAQNLDLYRFK